MTLKNILGIDVGGSGIKGAIVNTKTGELLTDRYRIPTPQPATPKDVSKTIADVVKHYNWSGAVGIGFPAAIQNGFVRTASNIDKSFIGINFEKELSEKIKCPVKLLNDADAAGVAEIKFGAGAGNKGLVFLVTVGTGLGTVLFSKGKLVPNSELGHVILPNGQTGEQFASDATRQKLNLSWDEWAERFNQYLLHMEALLWPDLIIVGGGVSKHDDKFLKLITAKTKLVPAQLLNNAGIIGAAIAAKKEFKPSKTNS